MTPRRRLLPDDARRCCTYLLICLSGVLAHALPGSDAPATDSTTQTLSLAETLPPQLRGVKVEEHLGRVLGANYTFTNETGQRVRLGDLLHRGRPVVLQLVYYSCPMLCGLVLNGFMDTMKKLDWTPGENYDVITISINPLEEFNLAAIKKNNFINEYGRAQAAPGWHWLTSPDDQVKALAEEVGFHYKYDEKRKEYLHEAAVFVLTSEGKLSRYLYGIKFDVRDVRLALLEAGEGKVGTTLDRIMLFCFHYDPAGKKYAVAAMRVMQAGGAMTALFLGMVIGSHLLLERRRARRAATDALKPPPAASAGGLI